MLRNATVGRPCHGMEARYGLLSISESGTDRDPRGLSSFEEPDLSSLRVLL